MKDRRIDKYLDGVTARWHNKKISFKETDNKMQIVFKSADIDADKPACYHKTLKGTVRETGIQMSIEAMDMLVLAYIEYRRFKNTNDEA